MLRSLFSGISGLRNHQIKMDVLGNNIANINTVGYKGGRVLFSEALNQQYSNATENQGAGFLNPMQVGLGMKVNSIDRTFAQGAIETTGNMTDLALEGEGFFVLSAGNKLLFSRAGNFFIDAHGKLVNPRGLAVQGWMLNSSQRTENFGGANLTDITIDTDLISPAVATQNVWLSGNLNAGLRPVAEVWTSGNPFLTRATVQGSVLSFPVSLVAGSNDQFVIEMSGDGSLITEELTLAAGSYANLSDLVAEINSQIAANANLDGKIEAVESGGAIKFRSLTNSSTTQIILKSGTNDALADLGFNDGDSGTAGGVASSSAELNDLLQVSQALQSGDTIELEGTNPDGSAVSAVFTFGTDGTTVQDLLNTISASYSGATVTFEEGNIVLTDTVPGDSETTIRLSGGVSNVGVIDLPDFSNTTPGFTGKTSASLIVYDGLGGRHNLVVEFTKTENPGEWTWEVTASGDEQVLSGRSGRVNFNPSGALVSFSYDNGANQLRIDPANGAETLSISLHADGGQDFSGLTQFESVSNLRMREQDGRTSGQLTGLTINHQGVISGTFSNGETISISKIALAQFRNNNGLIDLGDGLNDVSVASGEPYIFDVNSDNSTSIVAGALEMSNVDLAKEFTEMITAQRGFQASAKVITTADQLLDELIRIKR